MRLPCVAQFLCVFEVVFANADDFIHAFILTVVWKSFYRFPCFSHDLAVFFFSSFESKNR
jgi:hypothetical protein